EAHVRGVRRLGETALDEAGAALKSVKKNREEAEAVFNRMKAYKLLADYYERKVLAATCALIYSFGGPAGYLGEAATNAHKPGVLHERALTFLWEEVDRRSGEIKGRWGGKAMTLPELIELEKKERKELPKLFQWRDR